MPSPQGITRVILVILDGLRADAISMLPMPHLRALAALGAHTFRARTVEPSITTAALTSLFTGVTPDVHRIRSDRFGLPRPTEPLTPLPDLLREHGIPVFGHMATLPRPFRGVGARVAAQLGATVIFEGGGAEEILDRALRSLDNRRHGLTFLHWPDADIAGHTDGWMSPAYARGAQQLDESLDRLVRTTGVLDDPSTVLIALADHGGGGVRANDHDSGHPDDMTIPIVMAGGQVALTELPAGTLLVDIPATIPWLFGIRPPANYAGRPLREAFRSRRGATGRPLPASETVEGEAA